MRAISDFGAAQRYARVQHVAWLLTISQGDWIWNAATQPLVLGALAFPARLALLERWREWLPERASPGAAPGGRVRGEARLRLLDQVGSPDSIRTRLEQASPIDVVATLRLAWLDPTLLQSPAPPVLAPEDAPIVLHGRLVDFALKPAQIELTLADALETRANRRIGRLLRSAMLAGAASPSLGRTLPWVFGRVEQAELLPVLAGPTTHLAAPLAPAQRVLSLESVAELPPVGSVQIGGELIAYQYVDRIHARLGSTAYPVRRERDAASGLFPSHSAGALVRGVPREGFAWLAADHPCRLVEHVAAEGVRLPPGAWSTDSAPLREHLAQWVRLPRWPLTPAGTPAARLTASVEGLADDEGALIENPADVLRFLLTAPRLLALDDTQLDLENFAALRAELAAQGYRFARRLLGSELLGDLLDQAAREAGLWIGGGEPIRLLRIDPLPQPARVVETLDDNRFLSRDAPARIRAPAGYRPPDSVELVAESAASSAGRFSVQFPPESEPSGLIPRRVPAHWLALNSPAAGDLGELIWTWLGQSPMRHEQAYPVGTALLQAGEVVSINDSIAPLESALGWVESVEAGPDARARLTIRGPWAGRFAAYWDELNYIRVLGFGAELVFVLAGRPVARLSREGTLRLRGTLRERPPLDPETLPTAQAMHEASLYLSPGAASPFTPSLRLDADGNAFLTGTLRERTPIPTPVTQLLTTTSTSQILSPDAQTPALTLTPTHLTLPGILIERVRL